MGDYTYLVPANSKKQSLIFGFMYLTDLIIAGIGLAITLMLLFILSATELWGVIVIILPTFIAGLLVFPVASYHNVRVFIGEIWKFHFVNRKKYIWRGWCYKYEQQDE